MENAESNPRRKSDHFQDFISVQKLFTWAVLVICLNYIIYDMQRILKRVLWRQYHPKIPHKMNLSI